MDLWILLNLLVHHLILSSKSFQHEISNNMAKRLAIDDEITKERKLLQIVGNCAYGSDAYKTIRADHSQLLSDKRESYVELEILKVEKDFVENTICSLQELIREIGMRK